MEQFEQLIRERGIRLTEPRREVFSILNQHDQPLTIGELLKLSKIAERTSVYRTLNLFATLGIIETITSGWKSRYELAGPFKPHHHHLHCTTCRELIQLDMPILEEIITSFADSHEYTLTVHHIELSGLCKKCQIGVRGVA